MPPQRTIILTDPKGKADLEEIVSLLESSNVKPHLDMKYFDEKGLHFSDIEQKHTLGVHLG